MGDKKWWESVTVWATVAVFVLEAAKQSIETVAPGWAAQALPYIAGAIAIIGRFRATGPLAIK